VPGGVELKSRDEIAWMREANLIVHEILEACAKAAVPGTTLLEIDALAASLIEKKKAKSAFLGYHGTYPAVICASPNEVVVHGIPTKRKLRDGDIVSIDFGVEFRGYVGDSALTVPVGKISPRAQRIIDATRESLERAIAACIPGNRLSDVGGAVQEHIEPRGYNVVRDFVGHGIGKKMHEEPQVPNYRFTERDMRLRPGLVIAIEPMVNEGTWEVEVLEDGWTVVTQDGRLSAHFEHSVAITEDGPLVLSRP
jgi:methionyl aminopeptidase